MVRAWLVIDMTEDFVAPDGALTCGEAAQEMAPALVATLESAVRRDELIVFACDAHTPDDPEFELWPVHCVAGTPGAALFEPLRAFYETHRSSRVRFLPKTHYDAFFETELDDWLVAAGVEEVIITGVCTSICCYSTATGAYFRRYKVRYDPSLMADLTAAAHDFAVGQMAAVLKARPL